MSTETRTRANPFTALMRVFATGVELEDNDYKFDGEQKESQSNADRMMGESSKPINVNGGKANKKGGEFVQKMESNPEIGKAMREKHDQVVKKAGDKGIEL